MGVGGSVAKYMTRYKLAVSSQNPTMEKDFSLFNTVFHTLTGTCSISSTYVTSLYIFSNSRESKAKAGIFLQNNTATQSETLVHAQVMLLSWKGIGIQTSKPRVTPIQQRAINLKTKLHVTTFLSCTPFFTTRKYD